MKAEERVVNGISQMMNLAFSACETLKKAVEDRNKALLEDVFRFERDGDEIRRNITQEIYRGAFLPYLRPNIFRLIETVDEILNTAEESAMNFQKIRDMKFLEIDEIYSILEINVRICSILSKNFSAFLRDPERLREGVIVVRMMEKEADNIKFAILEKLKTFNVDFWDGYFIANFVNSLEKLSDVAEDAMDMLQIILLSL
ncbi:MAG: TIGR00153 family protein [Archaeoglobaceae archaeon]